VRAAIATEKPASTKDFRMPAPTALPNPRITATGMLHYTDKRLPEYMFKFLSAAFLPLVLAQSTYFLGEMGASCTETCLAQNMNCNPAIQTGNNTDLFTKLGVTCDADPTPWWATNQVQNSFICIILYMLLWELGVHSGFDVFGNWFWRRRFSHSIALSDSFSRVVWSRAYANIMLAIPHECGLCLQPCFVSGNDPNKGKCLGYTSVPTGVLCAGAFPTVQRVCRCDAPTKQQTFGTGLSGGQVTTTEQFVFGWVLAEGDTGAMTHYWTTYPSAVDDGVVVRSAADDSALWVA
jgi:hypothetical protein